MSVAFQPASSSAACGLVRIDQPVLFLRFSRLPAPCRTHVRRARAFPVLLGFSHGFHFVPKKLVLRAVGLDDHPVLPGIYHLDRV